MTYRLLFADDSATMHRVVQITLAQEPIELMAARDGREALALSHKSIPDAALLDVHMPELDGYSVCDELRRDPRTAHVPVLLLFSSQHPLDEARAREVGAAGSIAKPFETQALLDKLGQLRGQRQAGAEVQVQPPVGAHGASTLEPSQPVVQPPASVPLAAAGERPSFFGGTAPMAAAPATPSAAAVDAASTVPHAAPPAAPPPYTPFVAPPNDDITLVGARPALAPREPAVSRLVQLDVPASTPAPQRLTEQPSTPASGAAKAWLHDNSPGMNSQPTGVLPSPEALGQASLAGLPELPNWDAPLYASSPAAHSPAAMPPQAHLSAGALAPTPDPQEAHLRELVRAEVARQLPEALASFAQQLRDSDESGMPMGQRSV